MLSHPTTSLKPLPRLQTPSLPVSGESAACILFFFHVIFFSPSPLIPGCLRLWHGLWNQTVWALPLNYSMILSSTQLSPQLPHLQNRDPSSQPPQSCSFTQVNVVDTHHSAWHIALNGCCQLLLLVITYDILYAHSFQGKSNILSW